jgi:hypothetical protein
VQQPPGNRGVADENELAAAEAGSASTIAAKAATRNFFMDLLQLVGDPINSALE